MQKLRCKNVIVIIFLHCHINFTVEYYEVEIGYEMFSQTSVLTSYVRVKIVSIRKNPVVPVTIGKAFVHIRLSAVLFTSSKLRINS